MLATLVVLLATQTPTTTAPSYCERAAVTTNIPPLYYPQNVRKLNLGYRSVLVMVTLDATGRVRKCRVLQSSGVASLDNAALQDAERTTYEPAMHDCRAVGGTFGFRATFGPEASPSPGATPTSRPMLGRI
jgi:TonB family protein